MYMTAIAEDMVRIPPRYFGMPLKAAALRVLRERYEGRVDPEIKAIIITVLDILEIDELGRIIPGDGGTWHRTVFELLLFRPEPNEVIEGDVVDVVEHGIFVNIGPVDGYIHVSQISPSGRVDINPVNKEVVDTATGVVIRRGDAVRAKVQAVSFRVRPGMRPRISLTMRGGEFLGKLEEIEKRIEKIIESRGAAARG